MYVIRYNADTQDIIRSCSMVLCLLTLTYGLVRFSHTKKGRRSLVTMKMIVNDEVVLCSSTEKNHVSLPAPRLSLSTGSG